MIVIPSAQFGSDSGSSVVYLTYIAIRISEYIHKERWCLVQAKDRCNIVICMTHWGYRQVSNIRRTLVGNKIVDNSDVVGASPVGAAPTTSSLST